MDLASECELIGRFIQGDSHLSTQKFYTRDIRQGHAKLTQIGHQCAEEIQFISKNICLKNMCYTLFNLVVFWNVNFVN